jgi:hypothetical protein
VYRVFIVKPESKVQQTEAQDVKETNHKYTVCEGVK